MDQSAAPWRAIEDVTPAAASAAGAAATAPTGASNRLLALGPLTLGIAAAALLIGVVAVWLVISSGHGVVLVEGGAPIAGASDAVGGLADRSGAPVGRGTLVVDVQGAVLRPGVVRLPAGSRVADAITAAGGYGPRVATDRVAQVLNLAALLKDGDQVVVPSRGDPDPSGAAGGGDGGRGGSGSGGSPAGGPVDLNHATIEQLDALPGIGPVTAGKIVAAREEQTFSTVEDLRTRKIVGAATFDKIKDLVVVR
ncbi:MAG TPA: helix-hairpin-helix domain-containing protein [Candidatus Limnocylindrales bacterium]|jgi:competence protein ComEA